MSFDVFLQRFQDGKSAAADHESVRRVLEGRRRSEIGGDAYDVQFDDGSHVEFSPGAFSLRGISQEVVAFMFEVAKAGRTVMFPAMEGSLCIVFDADQKAHLPRQLSEKFNVVECQSAEELAELLSGGYSSWRAYRDRIVGK